MPKIHLTDGYEFDATMPPAKGQIIECSTFKIEPTGVVYQTAPIGSQMPHASMGYYPHSMVSHITHDEVIITEATNVTDDNA